MARKKVSENSSSTLNLPFPPVLVLWTDAHDPGESNWVNWKDFEINRGECLTVGFLVGEDKEFLWVSGTISPHPETDPMMTGCIKIPKLCTTFYQVLGQAVTGRVPEEMETRPRKKRETSKKYPMGFLGLERLKNETAKSPKSGGTT